MKFTIAICSLMIMMFSLFFDTKQEGKKPVSYTGPFNDLVEYWDFSKEETYWNKNRLLTLTKVPLVW